jgi:hypothetical protein
MTTFGPLAAKRAFRTPDGKVAFEDYGKAKHFRVAEQPVHDFRSFAAALDAISQNRRSLVVRGQPRPGIDRNHATRTIHEKVDLETGEVLEPSLEAVPRQWLLIDMDDIPHPDGMDIFNADIVIPYVVSFLPTEFHGVSVRWSFTAGHGFKDGIRVRLGYWSARSLSEDELKAWLGERVWDETSTPPVLRKRWKVDTAVFSANQPNYLADPILDDGIVDPVPVRAGIWHGDRDEIAPPVIDLTRPRLPVYQGTAGVPGGGYDAYRDLIGVDGFNEPIWSTICSYFRRNGAGVDAQWLRDDLESVIRGRGRDESQIRKHVDKLDGMITRARSLEAISEAKRGAVSSSPFEDKRDGQDEPPCGGTAMPYDFDFHMGVHDNVRGDAWEPPPIRDPDLDDFLFPADPGPLNPDTAPPEEYLVGQRLARSFVSLLVAPGATMKTSLQLLQGVAAITGRNLTGEPIHKQCRVWFISNEEPIEVLRRRLWAICILYGIDYEKDVRPCLFLNSTVNQPTAFEVTRMQSGTIMVTPDVQKVIRFAKKAKIDLMMVDPFISTIGGASENDNSAIDLATRQFAHIAAAVPLALELAHHVAKSEDCEAHVGNIARARGAGALVNKARYSYTVAKTNDETSEKYKLTDEERRRLVRFDMGDKNNYVLSGGGPQWFWLESVTLPNARDGREASNVGVPMLYSMEGRTPAVDPREEARNNRIRDLLLVNIQGEGGQMGLTAFIEIIQQANEGDGFLTATSENSIRTLITEVIPEERDAYERTIPNGKVRLFRRKAGLRPNSPMMLFKETIRG